MRILSVFFVLILSALPLFSQASEILKEGYYSGTLQTNAGTVSLEMSLKFTDQEIAGDPDETLPYKQLLIANFLLDGEGGPWGFTSVTYDLETGDVELSYSRIGTATSLSSSTTTTTAVSGSSAGPTLLFSGKIQADGSIKGTAFENQETLGAFQISPDSKTTQFVIKPFSVGHWTGMWTNADNTTTPVDLYLSTSNFSNVNPPEMALQYTPGRIGSVQFGDLKVAFSDVVIDYFTNSIEMSFTAPSSMPSGGGTLTLEGTINGDEFDGTGVSTFQGPTGSFKLRRAK